MNFFHQNNQKHQGRTVCNEAFDLSKNGLKETWDDQKILEAVLFSAKEPMTVRDLKKFCPSISNLGEALSRLRAFYSDRGINLVKIRDAYAFRTAPKYSNLFKQHIEKKVKLSKAARETLAIIAYNQPVTRSDIEAVRGVSLYKGLLDTLLETGWISIGPRRNTPGMPITFVTTNEFLDHFGLQAVEDMPNFQELNESGLVGHATKYSERVD